MAHQPWLIFQLAEDTVEGALISLFLFPNPIVQALHYQNPQIHFQPFLEHYKFEHAHTVCNKGDYPWTVL